MSDIKITDCSSCTKFKVLIDDQSQCAHCLNYICQECQLSHPCHDEIWESVYYKKSSNLEKLIRNFSIDLVYEIDNMFKELHEKNKELLITIQMKDAEIKDLQEKHKIELIDYRRQVNMNMELLDKLNKYNNILSVES